MIGAILGDIIGSPYEFDANNCKRTDFPLFSRRSAFTDDTVLTLAVAEGLMAGYGNEEETGREIVRAMRRLGNLYPDSGYGVRFLSWLASPAPAPYGSYGNGSAMRVSAAGWMYDDLERVNRFAAATARVTHNHPEGIKWAQATAAAIFLARSGESKDAIRRYVERACGCAFVRSCDEIRPSYRHVETCQETVPEAMTAFFESSDFESALRLAVSLGGDSDTLAAITGSIAEAYYPVPDFLRQEAESRLDDTLLPILRQSEAFIATHPRMI